MKLVSTQKVEATLTDQQFKSVVGNSFFQALKLRPADFELTNGRLNVYIGHCLVNRRAEPFVWNDEQETIWKKVMSDLGIGIKRLESFAIRPDVVALTFDLDEMWAG